MVYCSLNFACQHTIKNPESLVCQCVSYIKKQQYQCADQLCTDVLEPATPFEAVYKSLQKMYAHIIHAPHLFSLSLDGIIFNKGLPKDVEEKLPSHQDLLQYLAVGNEAFKSHMRICAAYYKKQIAQSTVPAFENFQALSATLIKPTIRTLFSHEMERLLAWRQISLAPRYQKIAEHPHQEIVQLVQTADHSVTIRTPRTIEFKPRTEHASTKKYIIPALCQDLYANDSHARLFCFRRENHSQVSIINPFEPEQSQEKIVIRPALEFKCAAFSDPARFFAVGLSNGTIQILYTHNLSVSSTIKNPAMTGYVYQQPTAMSFFNKANCLLVGKSRGTVDLYKNHPWQMVTSFDKEERCSDIEQIECSHDDTFAFFHQTGTNFVSIIDLEKEDWADTEIIHQNLNIFALGKANLIATAASTQEANRAEMGNIKIWDYQTNELLQTLACSNSNSIVSALAFAHDDMALMIGTTAGHVFSWNADQPLKNKLFATQLEYAIKEGRKADIDKLLAMQQFKEISHYQKARITQLLKQKKLFTA